MTGSCRYSTAFHSTIFGPLIASSAAALGPLVRPARAGLAGLAAAAGRLRFTGRLHDLGNLLLTFLILWAYMVFFQFMLVWIANMRSERSGYLPRGRDGWECVAWALVLFALVVPFFQPAHARR